MCQQCFSHLEIQSTHLHGAYNQVGGKDKYPVKLRLWYEFSK